MKTLLMVLTLLAAAAADESTSAQWAAQYDALVGLREQADTATKNKQPEVALAMSAQLGPLADAYLAQIEQARKMGVWKDGFRIKTRDGVLSGPQFIAALHKFKSMAAARQGAAQGALQRPPDEQTRQGKAQAAGQQKPMPQADPSKPQGLPPLLFARQLAQDMVAIDEAARTSSKHLMGPNPYYLPAMRELLRTHAVAQARIAAQKKAGLWQPSAMFIRPSGEWTTYEKVEKGLLSGQKHSQESYDAAMRDPR